MLLADMNPDFITIGECSVHDVPGFVKAVFVLAEIVGILVFCGQLKTPSVLSHWG